MREEEAGAAEPDYLTMLEVSRKLRFHPDTLRRHMRKDKLRGIEWIDFLGNGQLRATRKSVDMFIADRKQAMQDVYGQVAKKSRA